MTNPYPKLQFQVQEQMFDTESRLDEENFYNQRQGGPSVLTSKLTYILGDYNRSFPISSMTVGGVGYNVNNTSKEIDDVQFTYPVMGRDDKTSPIAKSIYGTGDKPGIGNSPFYLFFYDNWIKRFYIIQSSRGTQAYVLEAPELQPDGTYRYKVQLAASNAQDFCSIAETQQDTNWTRLFTAVPESQSRTTESNMVMPGLYKNQMSFMRTGMSWAGNAANKVMKISMKNPTTGAETSVWMDWFMWQFEKNWVNDCEHFYWYSQYNRLVDGTIPLKDLYSGKVIPLGAGILSQIGNRSTYSKLTYRTLVNKVGDALFGQSDSGNMSITLMTGTGGMREFHNAMVEAGATILGPLGAGDIASKFVTGTGYNLALGGYFDTFYHIDGYTVKVKKNPIFDIGRVALGSPKHPDGLPLESYRMVFLDDSDVDGQPNIMHVAQKGRSYIDGVIPGLTPMPRSLQILGGNSGMTANKFLATDVDESSYTRMKSAGIQILRANRCFDLQCEMGL